MSVNLRNLGRPGAYSFMPDNEYDRFQHEKFRELELLAEDGSECAEWAATVLTALSRVEQQTP
jgi:hypothetical protein